MSHIVSNINLNNVNGVELGMCEFGADSKANIRPRAYQACYLYLDENT
jgi:hypothetical protein